MTEQLQESNNLEKIGTERIEISQKSFRQYIFYWIGQQASLLGSSMVSFAIIWWLTITTQSELMLGIASLVNLGPSIFIAPVSGIIADRFNRKILLIIFDSLQATVTLALTLLFLTNNITVTLILLILGFRGIAQAFHSPVHLAITPTMVPTKHLSRMNGLNYLFSGIINIIGPVVGAALLAIPGITIGNILWADIITFGIALIPLLLITIPSVELSEEDKNQSLFRQITGGLRVLNETKGMVPLLVTAMFFNFFSTPLLVLLPLIVNKTFNGTEANYALVTGMANAAIVLGGLLMTFFKGFKRPVVFMLGSTIFMFLCQVSVILIPTNFSGRFWALGGALFLYALPVSVIDVIFMTSIQLLIPQDKLGRALAAVMAITPAIRPLGRFLSGVVAEFIGIPLLLIIASGVGILVILGMWFFTPLRVLDKKIGGLLKSRQKSSSPSSEEAEPDVLKDEFMNKPAKSKGNVEIKSTSNTALD